MHRRSKEISGFVNFPVNNPAWVNTCEGGMTVMLVAVEKFSAPDREWEQCVGPAIVTIRDVLLGDDRLPMPSIATGNISSKTPEELIAITNEEERLCLLWLRRHYPLENDLSTDPLLQGQSRNYLAAVKLGSTGWSGASADHERPWTCSKSDLTEEGAALYDSIQHLYPRATLHLLTYLDT